MTGVGFRGTKVAAAMGYRRGDGSPPGPARGQASTRRSRQAANPIKMAA
jgi:hypothetical protein